MASVLVVRKSALAGMPEPFREYVARHFVEKPVLGVPCMVAERHCYDPRGSSVHSLSSWAKGMAPAHSVDLSVFGRVDGKDLCSWIRDAARQGEDVEELFVTDRVPEGSLED